MSTALYRRYRPDTFADVIGQEHVTAPLITALGKDAVSHAYLFSGPRGCGKTTSARILARCLNCAQGPTGAPCGTCDSCQDLATGGPGSLDVIEIDAASHGGVDDARDLRERATFSPVRDRYKIFIIDEAHMVTAAGFNALLKIVEEPPEHIKFIFATTEPDKVIGTIRSRTHHYPFRLVPPEPLLEYLERLCSSEQVAVAPGVLQLVLRAGGGSVRDTLSVLDQLIAGAGEEGLNYERAVALLGFTHTALLDEVVESVAALDGSTAFAVVDRVVQSGQDPRRFVEDLLERLRDLIIIQAVPENPESILRAVPADQIRTMQAQSQQLGAAELSRAADTAADALTEMVGATSPRLHLELLMARLLLPHAEQGHSSLAARLERLERRMDFTSGAGVTPAGEQPSEVETSAEVKRQGTTANPTAQDAAAFDPQRSTTSGTPTHQAEREQASKTAETAATATEPPAQQAPTGLAAARAAAARTQAPQTPAVQDSVVAEETASQEEQAEHPAGNTPASAEPSLDPEPPAPESRDSASGQWPTGMPEIPPRRTPAPSQADGWVTPGVGWESPPQAEEPTQPSAQPNQRPAVERQTEAQPANPAAQQEQVAPPADRAPQQEQAAPPAQPQTQPQPEPEPQGPAPTQPAGGGNIEMMQRAWPDIVETMKSRSRVLWMTLKDNGAPAAFDGHSLSVGFSNEGARNTFANRGGEQALGEAVQDVLGMQISFQLVQGAPPSGGGEPPKAERRPEPQHSEPAFTPREPQEDSAPDAVEPPTSAVSAPADASTNTQATPSEPSRSAASAAPSASEAPAQAEVYPKPTDWDEPAHDEVWQPSGSTAPWESHEDKEAAVAPDAPSSYQPPSGPAPVPVFARRANVSGEGASSSPASPGTHSDAAEASPRQGEPSSSAAPLSRAAGIRQRLAARHSSAQEPPMEEPPPDPMYDTAPPPDWAEAAAPSAQDDIASDDDIQLESSGVFGRRAIERILGGVLLEEQHLHDSRP